MSERARSKSRFDNWRRHERRERPLGEGVREQDDHIEPDFGATEVCGAEDEPTEPE